MPVYTSSEIRTQIRRIQRNYWPEEENISPDDESTFRIRKIWEHEMGTAENFIVNFMISENATETESIGSENINSDSREILIKNLHITISEAAWTIYMDATGIALACYALACGSIIEGGFSITLSFADLYRSVYKTVNKLSRLEISICKEILKATKLRIKNKQTPREPKMDTIVQGVSNTCPNTSQNDIKVSIHDLLSKGILLSSNDRVSLKF